jgi:hypothetical protein
MTDQEHNAEADGDRGRSYEAAVARLARSQPRPVMRLANGQSIVGFLGEKFAERDAAEAAAARETPEAGQ